MKIIKVLIIVFFVFLTLCFSIFEINTGASIFAIFSIFFVLLFYGNKFELVEVLGAKFKLKELNNSIEELKELSKVVACISLDLLQESNRWVGKDYENRKLNFFLKIDKILNKVNISEIEKNEIYDKYWHKWVLFDYANMVSNNIKNTIDASSLNDKEKTELKSLCNPYYYADVVKAYDTAIQKI